MEEGGHRSSELSSIFKLGKENGVTFSQDDVKQGNESIKLAP